MVNNEEKYSDIFNMPHHVSQKHPQMSRLDRAAQFAPFAALTGHDDAIKETARLTDENVELDESAKLVINEKLRFVLELADKSCVVSVTYFVPDKVKQGGKFITKTGTLSRYDEYGHKLIFDDKSEIGVDSIIDISGSIIDDMF